MIFLCGFNFLVNAQEDSTGKNIVKIQYFNINNGVQYLQIESSFKKNKKNTSQPNKTYDLYLDSSNTNNLIARVKTDLSGKARAFIPVNLRQLWDASSQHTFIVKEKEEELINDYSITKSKLLIDTINEDGIRSIKATVLKQEDKSWIPAADVELKIGIQRMGGLLSAGDEESYTTDSTGMVTIEMTQAGLPGDEKGNYVIAARVQDNEYYGSLLSERKVNWGTVTKIDTHFFDQRNLWTTRFRAPFWLLFLVYAIAIGVWSTIIYLILQIFKINTLGRIKQ